MSNFISTIRKGWWAFGLPGYRPRHSTYESYSYDELPALDLDFDNDFAWLRTQPVKSHSLAENPADEKTDLSKIEVIQENQKIKLPNDFVLFIRDKALHTKIRSCTDCYLELPDFVVATHGDEDGFLVHFLSDSQYVLHWFLYLNLDGENCVLVSQNPYGIQGFDLPESIDIQTESVWFCAPSFTEFICRFWLENEIWFTLMHKDRSLTSTENSYLMHYSKLRS